ncbi:MAG TPA: hypothetical protein VGL82_18130 [Bryobacteraceae bacterium]
MIRIQKGGYSDYNALQAKIEKRYSKGLTFNAAYSYSKTMALGENFNNGIQNPYNWDADRAVSSQDMTQHFVASAVYALPFGRGKTGGRTETVGSTARLAEGVRGRSLPSTRAPGPLGWT